MPLNYSKQTRDFSLYLWKIEENSDELLALNNGVFPDECKKYKRPLHQKQCLAKHLMFKHLNIENQIYKDSNGKPLLKNGQFISVSHAGNLVGIVISKEACGLDIEKNRSKILRVKEKFVSIDDFVPNDEYLHWIWTAKESIYKLHGKKALPLKAINIVAINFDKQSGWAILNRRDIELFFIKAPENFIICIAKYADEKFNIF